MSMMRDTVSASAPASGTSRSSGILISFITAIAVFAVGQVIVSHIKSATADVAPEPLARATAPATPPVAAAPAPAPVATNPTPPANAAPAATDLESANAAALVANAGAAAPA